MSQKWPIQKPPRLGPGDRIRVVAPGSSFEKKPFFQGVGFLEQAGYEVLYRDDLFSKAGFLAGDDQRRLKELEEAFSDEVCKAIFCARGGYGTGRLLSKLNASLLKANPKIVVGHSDLTCLLQYLVFECQTASVHGPFVAGSLGGKKDRGSIERLWQLLTQSNKLSLNLDGEVLVDGKAEGLLVGGNLCMLQSLAGLPWLRNLNGCILFLEDVQEKPYRIDRMLTHLWQLGIFEGIHGLICGSLGTDNREWEKQTVKELFSTMGIPIQCCEGLGHHYPHYPMPVGVEALLDTKNGQLVTESAVA